jgi:uncharacterized membrane protein
MKLILFPYSYRKYGWIILLLIIPFLIACRYLNFEREFSFNVAKVIALFGLVLAMMSKEKNHTEETNTLKTIALAKSFISIIIMVVIQQIIILFIPSWNHNEHALFSTTVGLIFWGMVMYYMNFWIAKQNIK